jgi:hypothetical protein
MDQEKDTAKQIIHFLDENTATLDAKIVSELASARHQAVSLLTERRRTLATQNHGGVLQLFGDYIHHHRALMATAFVVSAILIAFMVTQQLSGSDTPADEDALLLGSELPPEAYLDKGFDTWLAQNSQQ